MRRGMVAALAPAPAVVRVAVIEDDPDYRTGLSVLFEHAPGHTLAAVFEDAADAVFAAEAGEAAGWDLIVMDIEMPRMDGITALGRLRAVRPDVAIVMLTVFEDPPTVVRAICAGADGYLLKRTPPEELLQGIRDVHRGGSPMTSHIARKVVQSFRQTPPEASGEDALSPREREVLDYLSRGYLYKEIAAELAISYDTVHTYVRRIYEKLQVHSRTEAVAKHLTRAGQPRLHIRSPK